MYNTMQKHLGTSENRNLLQSFKTTTQLSRALKRPKILPEIKINLKGKGKDYIDQYYEKEEIKKKYGDSEAKFTLASQVKSLSYLQKVTYNQGTRDMIRAQKDSRRQRHLTAKDQFETTIKVYNTDLNNKRDSVKQEIITFFNESEAEILSYFDSLTDEVLLLREKDFVDELKEIIAQHKKKRYGQLENFLGRLDNFEVQRNKNLNKLCDKLFEKLVDIAFILKGPAKELTETRRAQLIKYIEDNQVKNKEFVDGQFESEKQIFSKFEQMADDKEERWRRLKHDEALNNFKNTITLMEYVNPPKRQKMFQHLKDNMQKIFQERMNLINRLTALEAAHLTEKIIIQYMDDVTKIYEMANGDNAYYDKQIEALKSQQTENHSKMDHLLATLTARLQELDAKLEEGQTLEGIIKEECESLVIKNKEDGEQLMSQVAEYIDHTEEHTNGVCVEIGKFNKKISQKNGWNAQGFEKMVREYELRKAVCADENDDEIDKLQDKFDNSKDVLRKSVHHPKLQENLELSFGVLDELEAEYRAFHKRNEDIADSHVGIIDKTFWASEQKFARIFELFPAYDEDRLKIITQERDDEIRKKASWILHCEILKKKQEEEEEERRLAEEEAKDGGKKKGKPKKKPEKKKGKGEEEEKQQRLQEIYETLKIDEIDDYQAATRNEWKEIIPMQQLTDRMFEIKDADDEEEEKTEEQLQAEEEERKRLEEEKRLKEEEEALEQAKNKKGKKKPAKKGKDEEEEEEEWKEPYVDPKEARLKLYEELDVPLDPEGNSCVMEKPLFEHEYVRTFLTSLRDKLFGYMANLSNDIIEDEEKNDKEYKENSLLILDERLRDHWPLKGRLEVEVYQVRSAEITSHKRRYERHIRSVIDDADIQTEQFNILLERSIEAQQQYEADQKSHLEELPKANSLSKLQGIKNANQEGSHKFKELTLDYNGSMEDLCGQFMLALKKSNDDFLIQSTLFENKGNYSKHEVEWYRGMMEQINLQLDEQMAKRAEKKEKMISRLQAIREKYIQKFDEAYDIAVDELAAKQGTGRKFGNPKRIAQAKLRKEMTKCENAQENINQNLKELEILFNEFQQNKQNTAFFFGEENPLSLKIRKILMTLRTCMELYGNHINAFKEEDSKMTEMQRVTYNQLTLDIELPEEEAEDDEKRLEEEKENLGMLFYQKENKNFTQWLDEIEEIVKKECQRIYTGEKSKLLTGSDNIPDYLREYLANLKHNAENFRIQSARLLRNSCEQLGQIAPMVNDMVINYIEHLHNYHTVKDITAIEKDFMKVHNENILLKEKHMRQLRPNLCNPYCKQELTDLEEKEANRLDSQYKLIKKVKGEVIYQEEKFAQDFLIILLNNYYFLMTYYQNCILKEDFIKLPGDENVVKKHYHLKKLIKLKEDGFVIDTSSERALTKKRIGVPLDTFNLEENQGKFDKEDDQPDTGKKDKGKKSAKGKDKGKAAKGGKGAGGGNELAPEEEREGYSREMNTYKTPRQNSLYTQFRNAYKKYKKRYFEHIEGYRTNYEKIYEAEMKYKFRWDQTMDKLFEEL